MRLTMNRKLLALLGAAILTLGIVAVRPSFAAQTTGSASPTTQGQGKEKLHQALERLRAALTQLDLTTPQKQQIKSIFTETRSKLQALKGEKTAKGEGREIVQQARKDIIAMLDDGQKAKLKQILGNGKAGAKS
jgi:Spy/CpxP family protein refolding chaperone